MALGIDAELAHPESGQHMVTPTAPKLPPDSVPSDYITFLVNSCETIIGDRKAVMTNSEEISRLMKESQSRDGYFPISGINANDFEAMIKFFETKFIRFEDMDDCLRKLEIAKRFVSPAFIRRCVRDIDLKLTATNVIKVFRMIRYYVVSATPSKKSFDKKSPEECLESLLYNVFQFIDMNADIVLQRDEILELSFSEIELILRRDHLMTSELVLFNLIANWSRIECHRRNLDLSPENRRRVLGSLCYVPRYLRMTPKDFELICQRINILDPEEVKLIQEAFKGKHSHLTSEQSEMLAILKKVRPKYSRMPVYLSDRSNPKNYSKKMRKYEQSLSEDGQNSCLYWFCGCYALVCD